MIRLSRLRYTGHVLRMDNTRLPKVLLNGEINVGKSKVGRPQQKCRSCIKEDLKLFKIWNEPPQFGSTQLPELTSNREQWRKLVHKAEEIFQNEWGKKKKKKYSKKIKLLIYRLFSTRKSVLIVCQFPMDAWFKVSK